jgi:hypothetical protein
MTVEELKAEAMKSRFISSRNRLIQKGLNILRSQGSDFHLETADISALGLDEEETKIMVKLYIAIPLEHPKELDEGNPKHERSVNLTSSIVRLTGKISTDDAEAFQKMSDLKGTEILPMSMLVNTQAVFTITGWLNANHAFHNYIPVGWQDWEKKWDHATLAKFVTRVWGRNRALQTSLTEEIREFDLGVEKDILNIASEEATLGKLNALIEKFPAELDDPEKQIVLCIIMTKKMHEGHEIRHDMISMIKPVTID